MYQYQTKHRTQWLPNAGQSSSCWPGAQQIRQRDRQELVLRNMAGADMLHMELLLNPPKDPVSGYGFHSTNEKKKVPKVHLSRN